MPDVCSVILSKGTAVCVNGVPVVLTEHAVVTANVEDLALLFAAEADPCDDCSAEPKAEEPKFVPAQCGVPGCPLCAATASKRHDVAADMEALFAALNHDAPAAPKAPEEPKFNGVLAGATFRRPLVDRLRQRLIDDAVDNGADPAKAAKAVNDLTAEHPLIDLLTKFDWATLITVVLKLIALLG